MAQDTAEALRFEPGLKMEDSAKWSSQTGICTPFGPSVEMHLFGRQPEGISWKLGDKTDPNSAAIEPIGVLLASKGIPKVLSPVPDFSGRICKQSELTKEFVVYSDFFECEVEFYRGAKADGVEIKPGEAYFLASGDCPTLVLYDPVRRRLVCTHAGRDCLFDRKNLIDEANPRQFGSVVEAGLNELDPDFIERQKLNLKAFIACGIGGQSFSHPLYDPTWGPMNRKIVEHLTGNIREYNENVRLQGLNVNNGHLFLKEVIRHQLQISPHKFLEVGTDCIDTYGDMGPDGQPIWWSNRRGDKNERNGVLVIFHDE